MIMGNLLDWIGTVDRKTSGFAWFTAIGGKEQYLAARMAPPDR